MCESFKLPIEYIDKKMTLEQHIIDDLELVKLNIPDAPQDTLVDDKSIFGILFTPSHILGEKALVKMTKYYSYDKKYLKDTQKIIEKYTTNELNLKNVNFNQVYQEWEDIKKFPNFKDYYHYFNWNILEQLNNNDYSLQCLTLYTLTSPVLSLLSPLFALIVPFFIIKIKGLPLTFSEYYGIILLMIKNHSIGQVILNFNSVDLNKKVYLLFSLSFYLFSIYQNIITCWRFWKNIKKIHDVLFSMKYYLEHITQKMDHFMSIIIKYKTYSGFYNDMKQQRGVLSAFLSELIKVTPLRLGFNKCKQLGFIMNQFYQLYNNPIYNDAFQYSFYCIGYLDNLENFSSLIGQVTKCNYVKNGNTHLKNMYYPALLHKKHVKNSIELSKNIVITGPNASGKTTAIKSVLINIILSQQLGFGCYEKANLKLYKYLHCYLNIPDTSGRDSLFQAEARRCKEIVESIRENKSTHFCIFDELYSGTNPEEAVISANAFMKYLSTKGVDCLLTTHYIELCDLLKECAISCKMDTKPTNNGFEYTYKLVPGVSKIKGGIKILNDMNYPKEILEGIESNSFSN